MNKLKLSTQLHLVSGVLIAVAVVVGIIGIVGIRKTNAGLETVYNDRVVPLQQLKAIADDYAVAIIDAANKANAGLFTAEETLRGIEAANQRIVANWKAYTATYLTPEEKELARQATELYAPADQAVAGLQKFLTGKSGSLKGQLGEFDGPLYQHIDPISGKITELVELQLRVAKEEYTAAHARYVVVLWSSIGALVLGTLLGGGLGLKIVYSVTRVLREVSEHLSNGASQTASAAGEVSSTSQMLAQGASHQAATLEETSASLEEISTMTKRNAASAVHSRSLSQQAHDDAASGLSRITEMGRTLTTVKGAVTEMDSAVSQMQSSSQEIAKIIKTIDEIAFQTNLLALNAAVEAARAGESGAGFAVVADEVRSLAQRSAQAAKDTSEKIEAAVRRSTNGGAASKKVVASLGEIEGNARSIEQVFNGIVTQIQSLDHVIAEIASASEEQSQGITELNSAVGEMDKVTQTNAASAEENASASEELNAQANLLEELVGQLQRVITGQTRPPAAPRAARTTPPTAPPVSTRTSHPGKSAAKHSALPPVPPAPGFRDVPKDVDIPMPAAIGSGTGSFKDF
jgi:methyl-accepting chemotaxis protein